MSQPWKVWGLIETCNATVPFDGVGTDEVSVHVNGEERWHVKNVRPSVELYEAVVRNVPIHPTILEDDGAARLSLALEAVDDASRAAKAASFVEFEVGGATLSPGNLAEAFSGTHSLGAVVFGFRDRGHEGIQMTMGAISGTRIWVENDDGEPLWLDDLDRDDHGRYSLHIRDGESASVNVGFWHDEDARYLAKLWFEVERLDGSDTAEARGEQ